MCVSTLLKLMFICDVVQRKDVKHHKSLISKIRLNFMENFVLFLMVQFPDMKNARESENKINHNIMYIIFLNIVQLVFMYIFKFIIITDIIMFFTTKLSQKVVSLCTWKHYLRTEPFSIITLKCNFDILSSRKDLNLKKKVDVLKKLLFFFKRIFCAILIFCA